MVHYAIPYPSLSSLCVFFLSPVYSYARIEDGCALTAVVTCTSTIHTMLGASWLLFAIRITRKRRAEFCPNLPEFRSTFVQVESCLWHELSLVSCFFNICLKHEKRSLSISATAALATKNIRNVEVVGMVRKCKSQVWTRNPQAHRRLLRWLMTNNNSDHITLVLCVNSTSHQAIFCFIDSCHVTSHHTTDRIRITFPSSRGLSIRFSIAVDCRMNTFHTILIPAASTRTR